MGKARLPRPVDVRDDGARDGDRQRRARDRHRSRSSCGAATCCAASDLPFTVAGRQVFTEITPLETLEQALEMLDYEAFRARAGGGARRGPAARARRQRVRRADVDGRRRRSRTEGATVRVESSGKVVAYLGTTSHGQSVETTMAQVVADTLGVGYDDVTSSRPTPQSTPFGPGTGGSRTAVIAGGAAREAAARGARQGRSQIAAHALEASPDDLEIADGAVSVRGHADRRSMTLPRSRRSRTATPTAARRTLAPGLEATVPLPARPRSHVVERRPTSASSRSTATRGRRAIAALHRVARTAA